MRTIMWVGLALVWSVSASAQLQAGVARASITPLEAKIPTPLGGYGAREGKPAEGVHDTLYAKALVFEFAGKKSALVTLDVCSLPACLVEESLAKANIAGLTPDTVLMAASHTHGGLEGFTMDRRNVAGNPNIGVFSEEILKFVTERVADALHKADAALQPVTAGAGVVALPGMNRNRRGDNIVDQDLTLLRFDDAKGKPYVLLVNYTSHGTILSEHEMLASGDWSGNMQRTVEALLRDGATCMYTNGAEGDISPTGARGGSRWEQAEDYGRRVGIAAARLADTVKTAPVKQFTLRVESVDLPKTQVPPGFTKITGDEYKITEEQIQQLLPVMFPSRAPVAALRVNNFEMVTFPGEAVCSIGLAVKDAARKAGIKYPCIGGLTNDGIGYILTPEEYRQGGYESTTSFYGDSLGPLIQEKATSLGKAVAQASSQPAAKPSGAAKGPR